MLCTLCFAACDRDLVPAPADVAMAKDVRDGDRLAAQLQNVPGVVAATVLLRRPHRDPWTGRGSTPDSGASASVLVVGAVPSPSVVTDLARAALPEVAPDRLLVRVLPTSTPTVSTASPTHLARVGPFWVAERSRLPLTAAMVCLLGVVFGLSVLLLRRERNKGRIVSAS